MPAAAVVGLAALGTGAQIYGANKAASAQKDAAKSANALQKYIFEQQRADQAPWRNVGVGALGQIAGLYGLPFSSDPNYGSPSASGQPPSGFWSNAMPMSGQGGGPAVGTPTGAPQAGNFRNFFASPDYQFRLGEGNRAIEQSAAARGLLGSGSTLRDLTQYSQGLASSEYGNWFNRLAGIAGLGQTANAANAQAGQNYAANYGQNMTNIGNARASAYQSYGNALGGLASAGAYGLGSGAFRDPYSALDRRIG